MAAKLVLRGLLLASLPGACVLPRFENVDRPATSGGGGGGQSGSGVAAGQAGAGGGAGVGGGGASGGASGSSGASSGAGGGASGVGSGGGEGGGASSGGESGGGGQPASGAAGGSGAGAEQGGTAGAAGAGGVCSGVEDCTTEADEDCDGVGWCASCLAIQQHDASLPSGVYTIDPDGTGPELPFQAYCDQAGDGGGWTLALKISDAAGGKFKFNDPLWQNAETFQPSFPELSGQAAKLASFSTLAFSELRVGMADNASAIPQGILWLVLPVAASSLTALFSGPTATTSLGLSAWEAIPASTLMTKACNEGINVQFHAGSLRVGLWGVSGGATCSDTADTWIGLGPLHTAWPNCGNLTAGSCRCQPTSCSADYGFLMVR